MTWANSEWFPILLGLAGLLVLILLGYVGYRRLGRRREPPPRSLVEQPPSERPEPAPLAELLAQPVRFPIVLVHGWLGFDTVALAGLRQSYFRGVRERLEAHGHTVHVVRVAPLSSIKRRAGQLAAQLDQLALEKANLVAHSMGGLDARYAIAHLGVASKVASLTTVGTPHRGTPLAEARWQVSNIALWRRVTGLLGADLNGLYDIGTRRMAEFNREVPDHPDVRYFSYVAVVSKSQVHRLLGPSHAYLQRLAGDNDGLVPADSQRWGECLGNVDADHWAQIGWFGAFDAPAFYADMARLLADRGF